MYLDQSSTKLWSKSIDLDHSLDQKRLNMAEN